MGYQFGKALLSKNFIGRHPLIRKCFRILGALCYNNGYGVSKTESWQSVKGRFVKIDEAAYSWQKEHLDDGDDFWDDYADGKSEDELAGLGLLYYRYALEAVAFDAGGMFFNLPKDAYAGTPKSLVADVKKRIIDGLI